MGQRMMKGKNDIEKKKKLGRASSLDMTGLLALVANPLSTTLL
jgi:hypothetical protein